MEQCSTCGSPILPIAVPEFEPPPQAVRDHIKDWYEEHSQQYAKVWSRLRDMQRLWPRLSYREQVAYLKLSTVFSIYTIQVNLPLAEAAFEDMMGGKPLYDSFADDQPGFDEPAGLGPQKTDWIQRSLIQDAMWDQCVDLLNEGKVDTAHKLLVDQSVGLGSVKGAFTLANLGFVEKMCIDGNVARLFGADQPETVDISKYEGLCTDIKNAFPELSEILEPYELQWLVFDWQRTFRSQGGKAQKTGDRMTEVATHDEWFGYALGNPTRIVRRMDELTQAAIRDQRNGGPDIPPDVPEPEPGPPEDVFEDIDAAVDTAVAHYRIETAIDRAVEDAH